MHPYTRNRKHATAKRKPDTPVVYVDLAKRQRKRSLRAARRKLRDLLIEAQDGCCMYCGLKMTPAYPFLPTSATIEHIIPQIVLKANRSIKPQYGASCAKCNHERGQAFGAFLDAWRRD